MNRNNRQGIQRVITGKFEVSKVITFFEINSFKGNGNGVGGSGSNRTEAGRIAQPADDVEGIVFNFAISCCATR